MEPISTTKYKALPIGMLLNPAEDDTEYLSSSPPSRFSSRASSLSSVFSESSSSSSLLQLPPSPSSPSTLHSSPLTSSQRLIDELDTDNVRSVAKLLNSKNTRSTLPREVLDILNEWLIEHLDDPYPTSRQKRELRMKTGLTKVQLSNWFINVRRRKIFSSYYDLAKRRREIYKSQASSSELSLASSDSSTTLSLSPSSSSDCLDKYMCEKATNAPVVPITRRKKLIDRLRDLRKTIQLDIKEGRIERGVYL